MNVEVKTKYPVIYLRDSDMVRSVGELEAAARERLEDVLTDTGAEKVNLMAWSLWGLAARSLASKMPEKIASVTTVCTPHRGLYAITGVPGLLIKRCWSRVLGKEFPDTLRFALQPSSMAVFNCRFPNVKGVFYQSCACGMKPEDDKRLAPSNRFIEMNDGENDGAVSVYSAMWGQHAIVRRNVSHLNVPQSVYDELVAYLIDIGL